MKYNLLLILLLVSHLVLAQSADTIRKLDELFSTYNNATPGVAVAVEQNGRLIYNKAFGLANLEHLVPNTTETVFECGSVSKQFTAAAILLLEKEGKLSLKDDVRKYVPELPQYDGVITIQHLLNHTSGLKDWGVIYAIGGWPRSTRAYTQALSFDIVFRQKSLNFTPGSEYSYSNSNYVMLVLIVERVSGQSLAQFTSSRLFEPLGMKNTQWRDNFKEIIPGRAIAYSSSEGKYQQDMPFENVHGPGGLLTTTADLLRWNQLLETHELFESHTAQLRIQRGKLNNGTEITYAAGLSNSAFNGFDEISHSGATAGYRAWLAYYPQKKLSIVALSNDASFNAGRIGRDMAEIFLGSATVSGNEPTAFVALSTTEAQKWVGLYRHVNQPDYFKIDYVDGKLQVNGREVRAVHRDSLYLNRVWWIASANQSIMRQSPGGTGTYQRKEPSNTSAEGLQSLAGYYRSEDADATFRIEVREGNLWVQVKPGDSLKLTPIFLDGYRTEAYGLCEFKRDKKGNIIGFEVSLPRANRVPFTKINLRK
jgi:CubicO group peptidase (beta-lactamase class C family)